MLPIHLLRRAAPLLLVGVLAGCGGSASTTSTVAHQQPTARRVTARRPVAPAYPRVLASAARSGATPFVPAETVGGRTAAWVARTPAGVALLSFDQSVATLALHSGSIDAGSAGWRFGPKVVGSERRMLIAAFNGGFKLSTGVGGFMSYGRVAVPLRAGLGSIVTYRDGSTDIGAWRRAVPAPGRAIASVRQNLPLLIDGGRAAPNPGCVLCWGATLGGVADPARSALGITADGRLIWAGGEHLTVQALAAALLGAHVVRAVELDINPEWVAAYLYGHHRGSGAPVAVPVVPGQPGVPGQFLAPYSRDFFTLRAR